MTEKTEETAGPVESGVGVDLAKGNTPEQTAVPTDPEDEAEEPQRLGEIIVKQHDGARCVAWQLGTAAAVHGLTVKGIVAAARVTADFLDGLTDSQREALDGATGLTQVRITPVEWSVPLVPHQAAFIEEMMLSVVDAEDSLGRVA
jgi:hypothetical protein